MYTFDITLPNANANANGTVAVDTAAKYGYWERADGSEGGGLWFSSIDGSLELSDYDGATTLPLRVVTALRQAGFVVDEDFEP